MIYKENSLIVREARKNEWEQAMDLAWKNFLTYDAKDYSARGIDSFREFVTNPALYQMFLNGNYILLVAFEKQVMVGMITLRSKSHISLLFVEEGYHRKGIGKRLVDLLGKQIIHNNKATKITVNSSPYAIEFYHNLGFNNTDKELINDGICYTPMIKYFNGE